ncbi:MAG: ABC transporter ATP-binding protein [Alphaproteobacteria bacterium]|nr:ABC transporter ATP-binding protein [Alphaproteobacteria bacterium]
MAPALVDARDLHVFYDESHVLHGVDFRVAPGETVALIGRNGMGKTTTLRAILGLVPPRRGTVSIHGRDMTGEPTHRIARAGLGYVPEGRQIFPRLSVRENLAMAARPGPGGRTDWTVERVLETFPRLAERPAQVGTTLSGGEQQMLAIGRALVTNPDVLLLDEATEGLAPLIRKEIWRVVVGLKASGLATVIVDKNVHALLDIADRAVILVKGHVVHASSGAELRARPDVLQRHIGL